MCPPRLRRKASPEFVRALGESIRARRLRLRQTRLELARGSRLSEARIARVEDGDPDVDLLQLVSIAGALGVSLRSLLQRAERKVGWRAGGRKGASKLKGVSKSGRGSKSKRSSESGDSSKSKSPKARGGSKSKGGSRLKGGPGPKGGSS